MVQFMYVLVSLKNECNKKKLLEWPSHIQLHLAVERQVMYVNVSNKTKINVIVCCNLVYIYTVYIYILYCIRRK